MPRYTRKKLPKQAKVGNTEDRISNCPDEILTCILSLLSTKEAVRTSILSKRWKFVWTFVPALHVCEHQFLLKTERSVERAEKARTRFLNFVNKVLMAPNVLFLEKVVIDGLCHDSSHIESWICAALERNVRKLELCIFSKDDKPRQLPQSLFSCNTLVDLKLHVDMVLNFPMTSTCFPNLKVLRLDSVIYKDDSSAQNLFSSCPVLEDLVIVRRVVWDNLETINVTSRSLKNLTVRTLRARDRHPFEFVIDAPALESLEIYDCATQDYVARDLSSIIKAKLQLSKFCSSHEDYDYYLMRLLELLRRISKVKTLSLGSSTMMSLFFAKYDDLPTFHHLICLEFFLDFEYKCDWRLVLELLNSAPILEVLIIEVKSVLDEEDYSPDLDESSSSRWDVLPDCLLSHLKTIEIKGDMDEEDLELVRYFLKNAKVLEKMTISHISAKIKRKICAELFKLPRCSKSWSNGDLVISFVKV